MSRIQEQIGWHVCPEFLYNGDNRPRPEVGVPTAATLYGVATTQRPYVGAFGMHAEESALRACAAWAHYNSEYLDEVLIQGDLDFRLGKWPTTGRTFCGRVRTVLRRVHRYYILLAAMSLGVWEGSEGASLTSLSYGIKQICMMEHRKYSIGIRYANQLFDEIVELAFWLQETIEPCYMHPQPRRL